MRTIASKAAALLLLTAIIAPAASAEVLEEIVAWVDGDIITSSEFQEEEQMLISEVYRRYTGDDLDDRVEALRGAVLMDMIDRKILLHRAQRMFDTARMEQMFYETFREQRDIEDDAEFERWLARQGMTIDDLKLRLVEMFAPEEVVRFEVSSRISVGEKEIDAYYAEHPDEFMLPDEVTLREIVLLAGDEQARDERRAEVAQMLQRLQAGEDFAEVAKEVSEAGTAESGGLLGPLGRGDLSSKLEEVAFGLPEGESSGVLELPYGFHIMKIESSRIGVRRTLEESRADLRMQLEDSKYTTELYKFMKKARAESEWCVKANYGNRLPASASDHVCKDV